jgi:hypothetical protein
VPWPGAASPALFAIRTPLLAPGVGRLLVTPAPRGRGSGTSWTGSPYRSGVISFVSVYVVASALWLLCVDIEFAK